MDPEKILAVLYKAAGLDPKKASPADLINAVQAYEKLGLALKGASEDAAEEPDGVESRRAVVASASVYLPSRRPAGGKDRGGVDGLREGKDRDGGEAVTRSGQADRSW